MTQDPAAPGSPGSPPALPDLSAAVPPPIPDFVRPELAALGVILDDARINLLARYLGMLLEVNKQFNLTAIRDPESAWRRHIIDSLTVLPGLSDLTENETVIDVGSGGGLPGVPLAIARPDLRMTLLEATGKKANFLRACVKELPLVQTRVIHGRAEDLGQQRIHRESYDIAVCRAIGPMTELLECTMPLLRLGGMLLAMKGPSVEAELAAAADALDKLGSGELEVIGAYPEGSGQNTVIVSVRKERQTPKEYPRKPGVPRQFPL
ncbi:MAG: 16S rRNA (guanine(527)-N(7))-methyltransferase RsmG [Planctomycetota bacterium]|nr:16S rRNA (guanine(527)-N(7))-methyltransferase RsmG [Planctomycetota bacterium]